MPAAENETAGDYRRPLGRGDQAWRLAAAAAIGALVWLAVLPDLSSPERWYDLLLGLAAFAIVTRRRRRPMTVAVVTTALAAASAFATGASVLAVVSLAAGRSRPRIAAIGILSVLSGEVWMLLHPTAQLDPRWLSAPVNAVCVSSMLAWGMYLGSRSELLWTLRRRAEMAEAERDRQVSRARLEERTRIAREMHDVLAHRISQIAVHAGALAYREGVEGREVQASADLIRKSAHDALTDLRGVLGVLRGGDGEVLHLPQPTYGDLADLVEEARRSGTQVELDDRLTHDQVPSSVGRTVYRIVQEGLTNARKHAPGARVYIDIRGTTEGITLVMRNGVGFGRSVTPGAGLGLVGLAERVHLSGGTLRHGVEAGDFVLRAWVPLVGRSTAAPRATASRA